MSTQILPRPAAPAPDERAPGSAPTPPGRWSLRRLARGPAENAVWVRPALIAVTLLAAFLCFWHLSISGYSNEYYAAAARSGSESWKAWFFGSLDPGSFITVDKPPLSLWLMGLSGRVLGFSSFSMLLPEAACTVAAVMLLFATVKRLFSPAAAVAAATAFALTPISIAVARVNNPDALLILLLVGSAYLMVRALQSEQPQKWLVWCGVLVGLAFMTKMLQGWMVLPALTATYLLAGPPRLLTRIKQLTVAGLAMAAVSAAWPIAVSLWPGAKPYIGGSTNGSVWDLITGYNGLGRIFGTGEGMGGGGFGGTAGLGRMFNDQVGGQIAWLLPLAAVSLITGLFLTRRAKRTDLARAGYVLFGVWALVHVLIFSTQKGIFHPYYVSALAPALAALAGAGTVALWQSARSSWTAWSVLAATTAGTAYLAVVLLQRTPDFHPIIRTMIPVLAAIAIAASLALRIPAARKALPLAIVCGTLALLGGPASYAFDNVGHALNGNNVLGGPTVSGGTGGFGGGMPGGGTGGPPSGTRPTGAPGGTAPTGTATRSGTRSSGGGGMGGGSSLSTEVISYLKANQGSAKYLVAAQGSQSTASIILATGEPVVTIGGFSGNDPAPTVSQLAQLVKSGQLKYVLVGSGGGRGGPGGGGSSDLTAWITAHGKAVTAVTTTSGTLYKLSV